MKRREKRLIVSLLVVIVSILMLYRPQWFEGGSVPAPAKSIQAGLYSVNKVDDGDTITVDMDGVAEKIRMIGVDTPETQHPSRPVECYGLAASSYTKKLIGANSVRLEADPTNMNRDRYDRLLRYVYLPDGTLVNAKIIQDGYGFAYTHFPFEKLEQFRGYEQAARDKNLGLWASCPVTIDKNGQQHSQ